MRNRLLLALFAMVPVRRVILSGAKDPVPTGAEPETA